MTTDAWSQVPVIGSPLGIDEARAIQSLVAAPSVWIAARPPVDVVNVTGATIGTGRVTTQLPVTPLNGLRSAAAIVYRVVVTSTTGIGATVLVFNQAADTIEAGGACSAVAGYGAYAQVIADVNAQQLSYQAYPNAATAFNYAISVVGFIRA